jgi:hypothetical protein
LYASTEDTDLEDRDCRGIERPGNGWIQAEPLELAAFLRVFHDGAL